jgi:release factor glutamine methyltransferase
VDVVLDVVDRLRAAGCVQAEREAELLLAAPGDVEPLLARRLAGERLEDVLGWAEFCGRRYAISPGVFVPRHRSEFLVALAASRTRRGDRVLDLCCGTGALLGALTNEVHGLDAHATDVSPAAVDCARRNLPEATVHRGDLFGALAVELRFDVVLANVPYVPTREIAHLPVEMRDHEDVRTLDGGDDGLAVLRRVLAELPCRLSPSGRLLTELEGAELEAAREAAAGLGLESLVHVREPADEWDDATYVLEVSLGGKGRLQ